MKAGDKAGGMTGESGGWDPTKTAAKKTTSEEGTAKKASRCKKSAAKKSAAKEGGGQEDREEALAPSTPHRNGFERDPIPPRGLAQRQLPVLRGIPFRQGLPRTGGIGWRGAACTGQ